MVSFNKFITSILLAVLYAAIVDAIPTPPLPRHTKYSTEGIHKIKRSLNWSDLRPSTSSTVSQLNSYHPPTTYKTFGSGGSHSKRSAFSRGYKESALAVMEAEHGINASSVLFQSGYSTPGGDYAYVRQQHNGIPFANAVGAMTWKNGQLVALGSSFVQPKTIAPSTPTYDLDSVIPIAEEGLGGKHNGHPPELQYITGADGAVSLAHVIQIQNNEAMTWYQAYVCAHSAKLISVHDFVAHASYTVVSIDKQSIDEGLAIVTDPQDLSASPLGWHNDGTDNYTDTGGNNVLAFKTDFTATTTESSKGLNFNFVYDVTKDPVTSNENLRASHVNAFYIANMMHDIFYKYGFTESAFNFQNFNFGRGGEEGDFVLMSIQDDSGINNANFATPPDGQSGVCRMFIWTLTKPRRDGTMENSVVVHEMTHGLTNRLTGGGSGTCLQTTEAGGLGEGWSDAVAEWTAQTSATVKDFVVGAYVSGNPEGLRNFPYSVSPKINPFRYSSIVSSNLTDVHDIGEVWANMLHNVYAELVETHGFSETARTDPTGLSGNVIFLHLLIDGLAIQPCNPTFTHARDAMIQADQNRYNGTNKCLLWKVFASRGLGVKAHDFIDDSSVPADCR